MIDNQIVLGDETITPVVAGVHIVDIHVARHLLCLFNDFRLGNSPCAPSHRYKQALFNLRVLRPLASPDIQSNTRGRKCVDFGYALGAHQL